MTILVTFLIGIATTIVVFVTLRRFTNFASQTSDEYSNEGPELNLREHLSGDLSCDGMIFGPTGRVTSRFQARMTTTWTGNSGVMDEHFLYNDGSTQDRQWRLTLDDTGHVRAEADDVIGAGAGQTGGNAFGMRYRIKLPPENGGHVLSAVDWMYLQEDGSILNRSQFHKYGIKVAELFAVIRPVTDKEIARNA